MTHGEAAHERGTHNMFTGYRPSPALHVPVDRLGRQPRVRLPQQPAALRLHPQHADDYAGSGISFVRSLRSRSAATRRTGFKVQDLDLPGGVDDSRFAHVARLLEAVNDHFAAQREVGPDHGDGQLLRAGLQPDLSPQRPARRSTSKEEDAKLRDAYGRNQAGRACCWPAAWSKRACGSSTLTYGGWDMHDNIVGGFRNAAAAVRPGVRALITDLDQRGLLDETLVMVSSEFGRTPKINDTAGRDHWPKVFSVVLAGGGVKKGFVYGSSDATATEPEDDPLGVEDSVQTVYHCLGIVAEKN